MKKSVFLIMFIIVMNTVVGQKIGLGLYPLSQKVAVKGVIKGFILEDNMTYRYSSPEKTTYGVNDLRISYSYLKNDTRRFYSGGGMRFFTDYYSKDFWEIDGYWLIIPIGFEIFPLERVPNFSFTMEAEYYSFSDLSGNFGLFYYLK